MAKYCPIVQHDVTYMTCLDCEEKECRKPAASDVSSFTRIEDANGTELHPGDWVIETMVSCNVRYQIAFGPYQVDLGPAGIGYYLIRDTDSKVYALTKDFLNRIKKEENK